MSRERQEDAFVTSYCEMLEVMQRIYNMTGQPDVKAIIDRARLQLGRVPHRELVG